jgi:LPXTG-motif cell wall-anchored protein
VSGGALPATGVGASTEVLALLGVTLVGAGVTILLWRRRGDAG